MDSTEQDDINESIIAALSHLRDWIVSVTQRVQQVADALFGVTSYVSSDAIKLPDGSAAVQQDLSQRVSTEVMGEAATPVDVGGNAPA